MVSYESRSFTFVVCSEQDLFGPSACLLYALVQRQFLQMFQCHHGGDANEYACSRSGNCQYGQVQHNFHVFYDETCHEDLAEVVKNATGGRYTNEAEFAAFLENQHTSQAESGPGYTVEESVDSAAKSGGKNDAEQENQGDIPFPGKGV